MVFLRPWTFWNKRRRRRRIAKRFRDVARIYGTRNVAKLLRRLDVDDRRKTIDSLLYDARIRIKDPINGCAGVISQLHNRIKELSLEVENTQFELSIYKSNHHSSSSERQLFPVGCNAYDISQQQHDVEESMTVADRVGDTNLDMLLQNDSWIPGVGFGIRPGLMSQECKDNRAISSISYTFD